MTSILDLQPYADEAVVVCLAEIHRQLDDLDGRAGRVTGGFGGVVAAVDRAISRLEAVKLAVVAAADRAAVATEAGMADTGAWLARCTRATGASAAGQVALAAALGELPETRAALARGEVGAEHAAVIAHARRGLPAGLGPGQVAAVEHHLVEQARRVDPATLRKTARRALEVAATRAEAEAHHDRQVRDEETQARARTRLTLHDNRDGTMTGHFTIPTLHGSLLKKVIQQIASPRRARLGATSAQAGAAASVGTDWAHRNGLAFCELLEHLPTDHLTGKVAATLLITLDHDQLTADLRAAGLDTADEISAAEARRPACNAGLLPAILNGPSQPLDLGRSQRFFTQAQRVALATRHTHCAAEGCQRPYAWCELHHRDPWQTGGRTDLDKAEPLCGYHHHRIHDPTYTHTRHPTGTITFHRRT